MPAQNIEQIVAWLLSEDMLGGFHFNDRRYADDDLTLGSIDPYQVFRIFHEIRFFEWETGKRADIAYMIDQSHNLKGKIEAMIQTVTMAQELFAKAALVDHRELASGPDRAATWCARESCCRTHLRPMCDRQSGNGETSKGLPEDPMEAFRQSGYLERITKERAARNSQSVILLCLSSPPQSPIWLSILAPRAGARSLRTCTRVFSRPRNSSLPERTGRIRRIASLGCGAPVVGSAQGPRLAWRNRTGWDRRGCMGCGLRAARRARRTCCKIRITIAIAGPKA